MGGIRKTYFVHASQLKENIVYREKLNLYGKLADVYYSLIEKLNLYGKLADVYYSISKHQLAYHRGLLFL
jgi:hypothetical protein